jgi:hypothetical protein
MYHANCFELCKSNDLPVYTYEATIEPKPRNRPQFYQILGALAKKIMYEQRKPVVSMDGLIDSLPDAISGSLTYTVKLPQVGDFNVALSQINDCMIGVLILRIMHI